MPRVLSLWFPTFSTDLIHRKLRPPNRGPGASPGTAPQHTHNSPTLAPTTLHILLTRPVAARDLVARCCARCTLAGIHEGMDLAHARSLLPDNAVLHLEPHRPDRDAEALHALACWAIRFTPLVAPDPPDGLLLDISGTELIHKAEPCLLRSIAAGARRRGLHTRIAAASTFAAAHAVARHAPSTQTLFRVPPGREREALANLPIAALALDPATSIALSEVGITRIGQVIDLPRAALASRFGLPIIDRLDKALGRAPQHIDPVRPTPPLRASMLFDGPTDHWESIEAAAKQVLQDLTTQLAARERGVRRLDIQLVRPKLGAQHSAPLLLSRPSRSPRHLWTLLRTHLERLDLQQGVEGIILTATRTARLRHQQTTSPALGAPGASEDDTADSAWGELIDTLISRLGPDSIRRIDAIESHIPERAISDRPILAHSNSQRSASDISKFEISNFKLPSPSPRPSLLLPRPEPASALALTPDGPLLSLTWRGHHHRILSCIGPERISPEWWRHRAGHEPPDRDYFAAQTDSGRWLWVCRQPTTRRWFVHGEWC